MSEQSTGKPSTQTMTDTDWQRFHSDEDIDTSDIPELIVDDTFWQRAKVVIPAHPPLVAIDRDLLHWFQQHSPKKDIKDYQSHINAVLRSYVEAQQPLSS